MRKSFLSRSLVAVASLAVASAALAAVPATAATATGITRDQVLAAAASVRATNAVGDPGEFTPITTRAVRTLANRACAVDQDSETVIYAFGQPTQTGDDADGVLLGAFVVDLTAVIDESSPVGMGYRLCFFGAVATTDPAYSLSGTATLNAVTSSSHALSGDVYVTPARNLNPADPGLAAQPSFTAAGNAVKAIPVKVATPKTTKQKKAAKKAYSKSLKSAKKSYTKAAKKAGDSKKKKATAKKAYSKKKAAAKTKYKNAVATFKVVNTTDARPFSISAIFPTPADE